MKKSSIKKICDSLIVIIFLSIIAFTLRPKPAKAPAYKFLGGRTPDAQIEVKYGAFEISRFAYSFEGDFNDIIAIADSELSELGYICRSNIVDFYPSSVKYYIPGTQASLMENSVQIVKDNTLLIHPARKGSNLIFPDQYISLGKAGWIKIVIVQSKKQNWLIYNIHKLMNKL